MARLLLDSSWGEIGVPSTFTSDQGPQFTSGFWRTIWARLGVRQAFLKLGDRRPMGGRKPQVNRFLIFYEMSIPNSR